MHHFIYPLITLLIILKIIITDRAQIRVLLYFRMFVYIGVPACAHMYMQVRGQSQVLFLTRHRQVIFKTGSLHWFGTYQSCQAGWQCVPRRFLL